MSLLDHLRSLFGRPDIPEETRRIFEKAQTPMELLKGLDGVLTENEVEFKDLERELERLEAKERAEIEKVRSGLVEGRQKRNALLSIQRLRKQMDNCENRLRIYDRNMNLHLSLIGKIQEMEAMKLRGIDEQRIDKIIVEFEEQLERYNETMRAGDLAEIVPAAASRAREEKALSELEREILGGAKEAEPSRVERREKERERAPVERPPIEAPPMAEEPAREREAPPPEVERRMEIE